MESFKNTDRNAIFANMFNASSRAIDDPLISTGEEDFNWSDYVAMLSTITGDFSHNASPDTHSVVPAAQIIGTNGNDILIGLDNVGDTLNGRLGDDQLFGGSGKFTDWASYVDAPSAVTVNLATGTASGGDGNDTLNGIEGIIGSSHNDTLIASDDGDQLNGRDGHDTLTGGDGSDNLIGGDGDDVLQGGNGFDSAGYWNAPSAVTVNLAAGTASGGDGNDTLNDIEGIIGSSHDDTLGGSNDNDTLDGGSGDDQLFGWDGNDQLFGGNGNDKLEGYIGDDVLQGGEGFDWAHYFNAPSAVTVNLAIGTASGGHGNDTLSGIEAISGSSYNDTLIGSNDNNTLNGGFGNDHLDGGIGDDHLNGDIGDDVLQGGEGFDSAYYDYASSAVTVNLAIGTASGGDGNDTLSGIEGIIGSDYGDTLIGSNDNNTLDGGQGNDTLNGGNGDDVLYGGKDFDWAYYDNAPSAVTVNLAIGTASGGDGNDTLSGIEAISGSSYNDTLTGSAYDNTIEGGSGNDTLNGLGGADTLYGEAGNDKLNGGGGADSMTGGLGNDKYTVNHVGDTVIENPGEGRDKIISKVTYTLPDNVENLTLKGTAAINGTGNNERNTLIGNSADNQLDGGGGKDTLDGGAGTNILTGGAGRDIFKFTTSGHIDTITDFEVSKIPFNWTMPYLRD